MFLIVPSMNIDISSDKYLYLSLNQNMLLDIYYLILLILPVIVLSIITIFRNFSRLFIYLGIMFLNIGIFTFIYIYIKNLLIYLPYLVMSFSVIIFANDYERKKLKKQKKSRLIADEGETRLESNSFSNSMTENQKEREEQDEKKQELKSREIVEIFNDKDVFVNRMYTNEEIYKDLLLYDEIKSSDNIIEEIYYLISQDGYIDRKKFNNILIKNNIIVDINNYEMEEEIRILEILSLRELKDIKKEKEEALQNDKKENKSIEELSSIRYNKKIDNNIKNDDKTTKKENENIEIKSIRNINKNRGV